MHPFGQPIKWINMSRRQKHERSGSMHERGRRSGRRRRKTTAGPPSAVAHCRVVPHCPGYCTPSVKFFIRHITTPPPVGQTLSVHVVPSVPQNSTECRRVSGVWGLLWVDSAAAGRQKRYRTATAPDCTRMLKPISALGALLLARALVEDLRDRASADEQQQQSCGRGRGAHCLSVTRSPRQATAPTHLQQKHH